MSSSIAAAVNIQGSSGSSSVILEALIAEEVDGVGDKRSGGTTLLEAFLNMSLRCTYFIDKAFLTTLLKCRIIRISRVLDVRFKEFWLKCIGGKEGQYSSFVIQCSIWLLTILFGKEQRLYCTSHIYLKFTEIYAINIKSSAVTSLINQKRIDMNASPEKC